MGDAPDTDWLTRPFVSVKTIRAEVTAGPDVGTDRSSETDMLTIGTAPGNDLILSDSTVSRFHLEALATPDGIIVSDRSSTNGTFVGDVRLARATVPPGTSLRVGRTVVRLGDGQRSRMPLHEQDALAGILGRSIPMRRLMAQVVQVAKTDAAVLIQGESGTGKELVARALHDLGARAGRPLVIVDCGSLAPTLIQSELFGHERGAYTGADRQHQGAFEQASGGTLFLDEIGELPPTLQASLLGVLERKEFRRLGGKTDIAADVRVVSATNRDLRERVNGGEFRLDLYYRLAVVRLQVPPLRERREDIPLLLGHFLREAGREGLPLFSSEAQEDLKSHSWPGNVRELRNFVEATLATGERPPIDGVAVDSVDSQPDPVAALVGLSYGEARARVLAHFESTYFAALIKRAKGNVAGAAREARMDRSHLIALLKRHGLK